MSDESKYRADIDLRNVNDSHTFAIAAVPSRSKVLDIGAADGSVARVLRSLDCRIWGVELDPRAAERAKQWCERVVVGDLNSIKLSAVVEERFDVILLLDVLEHLQDPLAVLRDVITLLNERGYVIISLPNVAHGAMRVQLLTGRFEYTEMGLLDRTHLRFFDAVSVRQFLDDADLVVLDESEVTFPIGGTEIGVDTLAIDPVLLKQLEDDPSSETYQFLFVAAPAGSEAATNPPLLPARIIQRELRDARRTEHYGTISRHDLEAELLSLQHQSQLRRSVLKDLLRSVRDNSERLTDELHRSI